MSVPTVPQVLERLKSVVDSNPETRQHTILLLETVGYLMIAVSKSLDTPMVKQDDKLFGDNEITIPGQATKVKAFPEDEDKLFGDEEIMLPGQTAKVKAFEDDDSTNQKL